MNIAMKYSDRIDQSLFMPHVNWRNASNSRNGNGRLRMPTVPSLISSGV